MKKLPIILFSLLLLFLTSCSNSELSDLKNEFNKIDSLHRVEVTQLRIELNDAKKTIAILNKAPQTKEELLEEKRNLTLMFIENEKALEALKIKYSIYTELDKKTGNLRLDKYFRNLQTEKRLYEDFKNSDEFTNYKNITAITYLKNIRKLREKFYHEQDNYNLYMVDKDIQYLKEKNQYKLYNLNIKHKINVINFKLKQLN